MKLRQNILFGLIPSFLIFTKANAVYISGLKRLIKGEGDSVDSSPLKQHATASAHGITFPTDTVGAQSSRQVSHDDDYDYDYDYETPLPAAAPTPPPTPPPTTAPDDYDDDYDYDYETPIPTTAPTSPPTPSPTTAPTSSPTTSPTSLPTSSPTTATITAPTSTPSSYPTMTRPGTNSWYITNNGNATEEATSKDLIMIYLPFNSTNRDIGALVFDRDCVTPFSIDNLFVARTTPPTSSQPDGFIQFSTTLEMNITAINATTYWKPYTDGTRGGWVEVCAETFLVFEDNINLGNDDSTSNVVFKNNILNISVSLTANYEIENVSSQREVATRGYVNTDYSNFIVAYECDETDSYNKKTTAIYNQGDQITICVRDNSDNIVEVEEFVDLVVAQVGNSDYNFILNGQWNSDITTAVCTDSTEAPKRRVCYAKIRALPRFFSTETPRELTISGSVYVRRNGRRVRQILRRAIPATENNNEEDALYASSRRVQENLVSGEFEVTIDLASADNSAASACAVGSTVAGLTSVVVGAAGAIGAALMI